MPVSIKMYEIRSYPTYFPVKAIHYSGSMNATFETEIIKLGKGEYKDLSLDKWLICHQLGESFHGKGLLEDGSIYDLVAISKEEKFPCFVQDENFIYTSGTTRVVSEQAIRRLRDEADGPNKLNATPVEIDLNSLMEYMQENEESAIKGGWFRGMKVDNVEVAYLGGGSVTESSDWERYEASGGSISALRIDIPIDPEIWDGDSYIKVLLTRDGNCVIYKLFGEKDLLDISIPLFRTAQDYLVGR